MEEEGLQEGQMDFLQDHSDYVTEILGRTPNWMIRWGISLVFGIVILLLVGAAVINYNDIVPAKIVITSKNPPIYLKARETGRLVQILVEPDQEVVEDQVLAEIENTANFDDVVTLRQGLESFEALPISLDSLPMLFPSNLDLGDLQLSYGNFLTSYQNYILFNTLLPSAQESAQILKQLTEQRKFLNNQKRQLTLFEKDLSLSKTNFERNQDLFEKGVISKAELENISRSYLNDQQQYEGFLTNISNTQIAIANFKNLLTKTTIQGSELENNYKQELEKATQNLNVALSSWEQRFLIKSPIQGKVTVFDKWNQYQEVSLGETLFTVIPENLNGIIGRVTLPVRNSGKVEKGQKVIIKLENYPSEEWGSLEGEIESISEVPKQGEENQYTVYIAVKDLNTSYGKQIQFKQEMQGTAEIILEELSIMQRVFYQVRKAFERNN